MTKIEKTINFENESKIYTYNIEEDGFNNLENFILQNYNTKNECFIFSETNKIIVLYKGTINFELQRTGTETQKQTYLKLKVRNLIDDLKIKYEQKKTNKEYSFIHIKN